MNSGIHYAEFQMMAGIPTWLGMGIVRPMPNLDTDIHTNGNFGFFFGLLYGDFLAARTDEWGTGNAHVSQYSSMTGRMSWTNWEAEQSELGDWEGMEGCGTGDTIGMRLDLNEGTLTGYKNDLRLGVMKEGLFGSYCWYATWVEADESPIVLRGELLTLMVNDPNRPSPMIGMGLSLEALPPDNEDLSSPRQSAMPETSTRKNGPQRVSDRRSRETGHDTTPRLTSEGGSLQSTILQ
ncbi:hypothetical protein THAOC_11223, partial [Thalassiosira oceanica]